MKKYILVNNRDYFREADEPEMDIYDDVTELYREYFQEEDFDGKDFESYLLEQGIEGIIKYIQDTFPNGDGQSSISIWELDVEDNESKLLYS